MRQTLGNLASRRTVLMLLVAAAALFAYMALVSPGAQTKQVGALTQYVPNPPGPPGGSPPGQDKNKRCEKAKKRVQRARERLENADNARERDRAERKLEKAKQKKKKACKKK